MCGIAGIYAESDRRDRVEAAIGRMTDRLIHRGPDDAGVHVGRRAAVGHRRLSIIDVKTGQQPIFNETGTRCIVFNGEIYNYRDLSDELIARGHRFATASDTETILHAYEEWGEACVERLRGMFAFCILDLADETMFLARDRFGIKPLFYATYGGKFVFASEMKAILSDPEFRREIEPEALAAYFLFSYVPAPLTIYRGLYKVLPGHVLVVRRGQATERPYWDLVFEPNPRLREREVLPELMARLREAVRMHLVSEVPLGAFLSGGIDSSVVVALMSGETAEPVKTFTVGFGGTTGGFDDERKYARLVADRYGTEHRTYEVTPDVEQVIGHLVDAFDEPFADDSVIPSYFIYRAARERVTVALSGLGGDEAFCGYERYLGFRLGGVYRALPAAARSVVRRLVEWCPEPKSGGASINHVKRFVRSASREDGEQYLGFVSRLPPRYEQVLLAVPGASEAVAAAKRRFLAHFEAPNAPDRLNKMLYCDIKTYLPDDILACTDRVSMRHSLEVRVPFLDHEVMEYCAAIPPELKMKWFRKKYLLKHAAAPLLPASVIRHRKQGFVGPMASWLRTDLRAFTRHRLSPAALDRHGLLNTGVVQAILDDHDRRRELNDTLIWSLLMFQVWFDRYLA